MAGQVERIDFAARQPSGTVKNRFTSGNVARVQLFSLADTNAIEERAVGAAYRIIQPPSANPA